MTPTQAKTHLETNPDMLSVEIGNERPTNYDGVTKTTIYYRLKSGTDGVTHGKFEMEKTGTDYSFVGGMPSILKNIVDPPAEPEAPRDFHFPMTAVVAWFGNTGKTLLDEDNVTLSRDGKFDRVRARIIKTEGEAPNEVEIVTPVEYLVDKDAQGNAVIRQVK